MRIDFEAPIKSQGFDKIASAEIKLVTEGSEAVRLPLTAVQLTAVFTLLDVSIDATGATLLGDEEVKNDVLPRLADAEVAWTSVQRAADMLGITRQRVYAIIRDGGLATRNDTGKTLVSVESINERITANPKAGRRWQRP